MSKMCYVCGTGGLGNVLFQLATAIYYCETYGYELNLVYTEHTLYGTSNQFDRDNCHRIDGQPASYDRTIFSKIRFACSSRGECLSIRHGIEASASRFELDSANLPGEIVIDGYNQNVDLFREVMHRIPAYLNLEDAAIKSYLFEKYGDLSNATVVGVRIGKDFSHMRKLTARSYHNAIGELKRIGAAAAKDKLYVVGDVSTDAFFANSQLPDEFELIEVKESDIVQIYFGMACRNYVLSESTFHLWMAYLGTGFGEDNNKSVVCFNDTDITNRNLALKDWIRVDY